jgi:hypothetical protein
MVPNAGHEHREAGGPLAPKVAKGQGRRETRAFVTSINFIHQETRLT